MWTVIFSYKGGYTWPCGIEGKAAAEEVVKNALAAIADAEARGEVIELIDCYLQ